MPRRGLLSFCPVANSDRLAEVELRYLVQAQQAVGDRSGQIDRAGRALDWNAIGAIAEGVGAAGMIASLLYVAIQVKASTRASAVESKFRSAQMQNDFVDSLIESPDLNDLWLRGLTDLDSLSESDYYRFSNMSLKAFWLFSAGHFQYRTGALSESEWYETRAVLLYWLRRPGCQIWWTKLGRASFGPDFRDYIDAELAALSPGRST